VLSHELGVIVLPLLLVLVFGTELQRSKKLLTAIEVIALAMFGVEALRIGVGVKSFSALTSLKWVGLAFWEYVALTLFPLHMSVERSTSISLNEPHLWFYAGLIGFVIALAYAVMQRKRNPILVHGLSWFGIGIAPFCIMMSYQGLAERFAYFAAIGMVGAIVAVCLQANHPKVRKALTVCVTVWSLWNFYRTAVRATDWSYELVCPAIFVPVCVIETEY